MTLPIYRHPSLTVLVDDSDTFLRSLAFQLDPELACKAFHNAHAALEWLRQRLAPTEAPVAPHIDGIALDIEQIRRISGCVTRFLTPSVLVVDYSMPQMNGVEFCQALRGLPCKKILFTGAADEKVAVDAFNRGLIDRYIKKSDDDALERLEAEIIAMQAAYFEGQSDPLRELLAAHNFGFMSDPAVARLVRQLSSAHHIVEHYLHPSPAGIALHDRAGHVRLLAIETEGGMLAHYEVARDNDAPAALLLALEERRVVPCFPNDGMYSNACHDDWHRYCLPVQRCQGDQ
ncbi:MAG: response regulator, partial [Pseudomonadota bacterium]